MSNLKGGRYRLYHCGEDSVQSDYTRRVAELLNQALQALPDYKGEVHRGIRQLPPDSGDWTGFIESIKERYQVGAMLEFKEFMSTSKEKKGSLGGRVQFSIDSKTVKYIGIIDEMGEYEVLFGTGKKFRVFDLSFTERFLVIKLEEVQ